MNLCQCEGNCGQEVTKEGNRFIKGHCRRGKKHSPETKQLMSENHADVSGEKHPMFGKHRSPKTRQLQSDAHKGKIVSPETRQLISKSKEGHIVSDTTRQLISIGNTGKVCSDKTRKRMSDSHKGKIPWNKGILHSPETRQLMSELKKEENNPNWNGGTSRLPYCPIWTRWLKNEIKERDGFRCQNPDCSHKFEKLGVHHIDYNKKNCSTNNLITLCNSCNSKANTNREYWQEFYSNILWRKII